MEYLCGKSVEAGEAKLGDIGDVEEAAVNVNEE
jgi:hypothetical protein